MSTQLAPVPQKYLTLVSHFTMDGLDPLASVPWVTRDAVLVGGDGKEKFRQDGVEVPEFWSDSSTAIVAEKYFRITKGAKEHSAKQMFRRVVDFIAEEAVRQGIFNPNTREDNSAAVFNNELLYILVNGMYAFNSPVWFNVGVEGRRPQCSACFIQSVGDTMEEILQLMRNEVMLFKGGSGTGSNLSLLRSSYETMSTGGYSSGPVSFMPMFDSGAGATKSGGKTRRAAKMVILNADHPDVLVQRNGMPGFIRCKAHMERLALALAKDGVPVEWNKPGNIYDWLPYQNANNSLRVTDEFMRAVEQDLDWQTKKVKTGEVVHTYRARELWDEIKKAAWACGDPGLQFDTTTNSWHTCASSGRINASNPCSEFVFLDESACNLGSLNLLKFAAGQRFDHAGFIYASTVALIAQEVLVNASSYPTPEIESNSHKFRPLGLGYTNLGALLTYWGLPYDSNKGRHTAAAITAIMTGAAYVTSAKLAAVAGPFEAYNDNAGSMMAVVDRHFNATKRLPTLLSPDRSNLTDVAFDLWKEAHTLGREHGFRNAQVTLLAPVATCGFLMGASTTGIEPMISCVSYKKLVGEGTLTLVNGVIEPALQMLGYAPERIAKILAHLTSSDDKKSHSIHDCPDFDERAHGAIFAEALGKYGLQPEAHIDMMAAVQPFLSGAISKTVNMPTETTPEQIGQIYMRAWKAGLKAVAIYRNDCKLSQPVSADKTSAALARTTERRRLPYKRRSETQKFTINQHEGYMTVSFYPEGDVAEIFIRMSKEGSSLAGWVDVFSIGISLGLQHGVSMALFCDKFIGTKFEPYGFTDHPDDDMRQTSSVPDYVFRIIKRDYLDKIKDKPIGFKMVAVPKEELHQKNFDGPPCENCGSFTQRSGSCFTCFNCGSTTGCG